MSEEQKDRAVESSDVDAGAEPLLGGDRPSSDPGLAHDAPPSATNARRGGVRPGAGRPTARVAQLKKRLEHLERAFCTAPSGALANLSAEIRNLEAEIARARAGSLPGGDVETIARKLLADLVASEQEPRP